MVNGLLMVVLTSRGLEGGAVVLSSMGSSDSSARLIDTHERWPGTIEFQCA